MDFLPIDKKNGNLELFAKIANSLVRKYNCRIRYDDESGRLRLTGDDSCKDIAIREVREFLDKP